MTIQDTLELRRVIVIDKSTTSFNFTHDLSSVTSGEEKLATVIKVLLEAIPKMGFDAEGMVNNLVEMVAPILDHPDNIDYSKESAIEDHVNDTKNLQKFLEMIDTAKEKGEQEFLLDVYKAWITYKLDQGDTEQDSEAQDSD